MLIVGGKAWVCAVACGADYGYGGGWFEWCVLPLRVPIAVACFESSKGMLGCTLPAGIGLEAVGALVGGDVLSKGGVGLVVLVVGAGGLVKL